jgi:hypothetical protein
MLAPMARTGLLYQINRSMPWLLLAMGVFGLVDPKAESDCMPLELRGITQAVLSTVSWLLTLKSLPMHGLDRSTVLRGRALFI